ncbi:MAG: LysR substrate-binding domain-containing protein [Betaproteobacteria bacterium]|nr:LysR substrate-binding domain-containing protein [Betaproteobacteria bacterium]
MSLAELRYIVALAREKHFRRAAERCHVSQPTLSVAVKKFEERLGVLLFERSPGDIRLTPIGEQICEQAEKALQEVTMIEEIAQLGRNPLVGSLRLGVIYTIAPYLLPRLVPALHRAAPDIPLYLQENFTHRLSDLLKSGELDAAIIAAPFNLPGVVTRPLYEEEFRIVLPTNHPLCRQEAIDNADLDPSELLLLGQGNCFRDQVVTACPQLSAPENLNQALESSSLETLRHMAASGAGIAVVPASAAKAWPESELFSVRPFVPPAPLRRVLLAWRVTFTRPQAIDILYQTLRSSLPDGTKAV